MSDPATEITQHLAWLNVYARDMTEDNWIDMRLRIERQLEDMETRISLTMQDPNTGIIGGATFDVDIDWMAMMVPDADKMADFIPGQLVRLNMAGDKYSMVYIPPRKSRKKRKKTKTKTKKKKKSKKRG